MKAFNVRGYSNFILKMHFSNLFEIPSYSLYHRSREYNLAFR